MLANLLCGSKIEALVLRSGSRACSTQELTRFMAEVSVAEAWRDNGCFSKVTGQRDAQVRARWTCGGLAGEISARAAAQADGFIIASLERLRQCRRRGETGGNISASGVERETPAPLGPQRGPLQRTSDSRSADDEVLMQAETVQLPR